MKTAILIPARMQSTRFPAKALAPIKGADGRERSLTEHVWRAAMQVPADAHYVVTGDEEIAEHVAGFGGSTLMTSQKPRNGTERIAEALPAIDAEIIVNFQGDAPLIPRDFVEALLAYMKVSDCDMATPVLPCDGARLQALRADRKAGRVGGTTAVFTPNGRALYFSKEVLPIADKLPAEEVFLHVGLYAYRRAALTRYLGWSEGRLEAIEGLEQLRFLENGANVDCVPVHARGREFWEVNNPEDIARVEAALSQGGNL